MTSRLPINDVAPQGEPLRGDRARPGKLRERFLEHGAYVHLAVESLVLTLRSPEPKCSGTSENSVPFAFDVAATAVEHFCCWQSGDWWQTEQNSFGAYAGPDVNLGNAKDSFSSAEIVSSEG